MTTEEKLKALAANIIPPKAKKSKKQPKKPAPKEIATKYDKDDLTEEEIDKILEGMEEAIKGVTKGFFG